MKTQNKSEQDLISVTLHPRSSLHAPAHEDYRSLTLDRLRRDSARVRSLTLKHDLALHGVKKSDLKPSTTTATATITDLEASDLQTPIVSGMSQGSGEYFSRVGIGRPPKPLYMVLDTGSDVTWVQCAPCTDCYQQADPIYQPSASSSFASISCDTPQCQSLDLSACRNNSCLYQVSYGDGSYTVGDYVSETLTLGNAAVDNIAIGCGHDNEGLFVAAAGLLGLGAGSFSFPSQIKTPSFSYCLVDRDSNSASTLQFGISAPFTSNDVTTPLLKNRQMDTFYFVELAGIGVGGETVTVTVSAEAAGGGGGGVIVDSGTAVTRLQTAVYEAVRDKFRSGAAGLPGAGGVALFDTCYDLSGRQSVSVPTVDLHFAGGKAVRLPARNYLVPVDSAGTFCFAFAPTSSALQIIGNVQQQGIRVGFDLEKSTVGFAPNSC
ncbi:hypothetical protein Sjap_024365 [Stephania japonica]|uniref:Peptidase A1 domain-containing protein n=1 Tax=Stephania japonica TaxID=461633 RepID=A0AAP0EIL2_9MAGN